MVEYAQLVLDEQYERAGTKQRLVDEFRYAAQSWPHERRVITRLEWGDQGHNPRFVATNLAGDPGGLYDRPYSQRGEAENRIKEAQVGLFATRTSCHEFASYHLRVLLPTAVQRLPAGIGNDGRPIRRQLCGTDSRDPSGC